MNIKANRKAFTLVELLIVIIVIGILFIVLISRVDNTTNRANETGVKTDIRALQTAIHQVGVEQGEFTPNLLLLTEQLNKNLDTELLLRVEGNKIKTDSTDPWGMEYELRYNQPSNTKGQIVIISAGPDMHFDTKDDILSVVVYNSNPNGDGNYISIQNKPIGDMPVSDHVCVFNVKVENGYYLKTAGNCQDKSVYYYSCSCGLFGTETFEGSIDLNTHINETTENIAQNNDLTHYVETHCKGCNALLDKKEESHSFINNICTRCNYEKVVHNHDFSVKTMTTDTLVSEATCTSPATYYYSCTCGEVGTTTFTDGDKLDHSYSGVITNPSTCVSPGLKTFTCTLCGNSYTLDIQQTDHVFNQRVVNTNTEVSKSTCKQKAIYKYSCICGLVTDTKTFEYGNYAEHIKIPGGLVDIHEKCSVCNDILSATHSYKSQIVTNATCTSMGSTKYTCSCGYNYIKQDIDALGHIDADNNNKCDRCGVILKTVDGLGDVIIGGVESPDDVQINTNPDGSVDIEIIPDEPENTPDIPKDKLPNLIEFTNGSFEMKSEFVPGEYVNVPYEYSEVRTKYPIKYVPFVFTHYKWYTDENGNKVIVSIDTKLSDLKTNYDPPCEYILYKTTSDKSVEVDGVKCNSIEYIISNIGPQYATYDNMVYLAAYLKHTTGKEYSLAKYINDQYIHQDAKQAINAIKEFTDIYTVRGTKRVAVVEPSSNVSFVYIASSTLNAIEGMTWGEWLVSDYNTTGYTEPVIKTSDYENVSYDDVIIAGKDYAIFVYELSETWLINNSIDTDSLSNQTFNINFTSNNNSFTSINFDNGMNYYDSNNLYNQNVYSSNGWMFEDYRLIDYGIEPQNASKEFYEWFIANAIKVYTIDGVWQFNKNQFGIELLNSEINWYEKIDFSSNKEYYSGINIEMINDEDYNLKFNDLTIFNKTNGFIAYEKQFINFGYNKQFVSKEFYNWFNLNAEQIDSVRGVWYLNDRVHALGDRLNMIVTFGGESFCMEPFKNIGIPNSIPDISSSSRLGLTPLHPVSGSPIKYWPSIMEDSNDPLPSFVRTLGIHSYSNEITTDEGDVAGEQLYKWLCDNAVYVSDFGAGIYDTDWNLLASWDELIAQGMDIEKDYSLQTSLTDPASPNNVLSKYENARRFIISGNVERIGNYAFSGNETVISVELMHGVKEIGSHAFDESIIYHLTLPNTIQYISESFAATCNGTGGNWLSIWYNGLLSNWDEINKDYNWHNDSISCIYCQEGQINCEPSTHISITGKWVFYQGWTEGEFDFVSNSTQYTGIEYMYDEPNDTYYLCYNYQNGCDIVMTNNEWVDEEYKIIDFGNEEQLITLETYNSLQSNAHFIKNSLNDYTWQEIKSIANRKLDEETLSYVYNIHLGDHKIYRTNRYILVDLDGNGYDGFVFMYDTLSNTNINDIETNENGYIGSDFVSNGFDTLYYDKIVRELKTLIRKVSINAVGSENPYSTYVFMPSAKEVGVDVSGFASSEDYELEGEVFDYFKNDNRSELIRSFWLRSAATDNESFYVVSSDGTVTATKANEPMPLILTFVIG